MQTMQYCLEDVTLVISLGKDSVNCIRHWRVFDVDPLNNFRCSPIEHLPVLIHWIYFGFDPVDIRWYWPPLNIFWQWPPLNIFWFHHLLTFFGVDPMSSFRHWPTEQFLVLIPFQHCHNWSITHFPHVGPLNTSFLIHWTLVELELLNIFRHWTSTEFCRGLVIL